MRIAETRRRAMERRVETVETPFGSVRVKTSAGCGVQRRKAEYDDLARIARERGMSLAQVRQELDEI
jgi:uncharacterized protein (DUF111 family)